MLIIEDGQARCKGNAWNEIWILEESAASWTIPTSKAVKLLDRVIGGGQVSGCSGVELNTDPRSTLHAVS